MLSYLSDLCLITIFVRIFFINKLKIKYRHIIASFLKKLRFKYRVSITNENTFEETWYTRLSRVSVLLYAVVLFLITFTLISLIIFITPLKHYLPGYQDSGNRSAIIQQSMVVDSLENEVNLINAYLEVVKSNILLKDKSDYTQSLDSLEMKEQAVELVEKSKRERDFVENYEEAEKYNIGTLDLDMPNERAYTFFKPVNGVVASLFNPIKNDFGISIITPPAETVKSVLEGKVVFAEFTFENAWVIQIQHENDYISIYKNNSRLLKRVGDHVKAGQSIALTGEEDEKKGNKHFYFEIWKKGNAINPQEVITFRN